MKTKRRSDEEGAAAVEFALVLPILLLVVFGIIVFGMLFTQKLALGNGARQAARLGAVEDRTCTDIVEEAEENSTTLGMVGTDTTVTITRGGFSCTGGTAKPCEDSVTNESVRVTITYDSQTLVPVPGVPETVELTGEGEFRCEFS